MRVLLFIRSLAVGGSQRQLVLLAAGLARRSHDVSVIVLYGGEPMQALLSGSGVRVIELRKFARWDVLGPLMRWRQFVRQAKPEVIYSFQPTQTALSALLVTDSAIKLVFGLRASDMRTELYGWLSTLMLRLETLLSRRAALIIANSVAGREDAISRGMLPRKIAIVPNGIDTDTVRFNSAAARDLRRKWGIPDDAFVIGMVARLDPMKDHKTFLAAAVDHAKSYPGTRFVCVGGGPERYRQQLVRRAQDVGLADCLTWTGELPDAIAAYSAFDVVTLSSAFGEGFPNAVGEAMACERPVVATDVGDVALVVANYGEVVPPRRPDLLCAGWTRLRERMKHDPGLGRRARQYIGAQFGMEVMLNRTESLLVDLCKKSPVAHRKRRST